MTNPNVDPSTCNGWTCYGLVPMPPWGSIPPYQLQRSELCIAPREEPNRPTMGFFALEEPPWA